MTKVKENNSAGFTIIELILALFLSSIVLAGVFKTFSAAVEISNDQKIVIITRLQAEALLASLGAELRSMGNGVPFDQANFQIGEDTLTDTTVTEPILVANSDNDQLQFRLNESGRTHLLTADFDQETNLTISLTDVTGLEEDEVIYITDSVVGGDNGLWGTIASVNEGAKTVTLNGTYEAVAGATFDEGSLLEPVTTITYETLVTGVTRTTSSSTVLMASNSDVVFTFMDQDGVEISPPLTQDILINDLRAIEVDVTVTSNSTMSNGSAYTVTVSQIFALRNLNYII